MTSLVDAAIAQLQPLIGVRAACRATGRPQANHYRAHRQSPPLVKATRQRRPSPRALALGERDSVRALLNSPGFVDKTPAAVYHELLDEGVYVCSVSTMYRVLHAHGEVKERRAQAVHPPRVKPELIADAPNRVWSWDITKLHGSVKWSYHYLYVIIDIYSRYVVGWMIAERESAALAEKLLADAIVKQDVDRDTLTIHADNGSSMASKPVAFLLADLGVTKTHSRPHVSNDNPYSESHFKTLKYRPDFPQRFGSPQDARAFTKTFMTWYNNEHRHSGIGYHTPSDVHHGRAEQVREARADVLAAAYARNPERFVRKHPEPPALPEPAWINQPPKQETSINQKTPSKIS
jgi:putative transposase